MAMGATVPFLRVSCGYVGVSDGWTDLHDDFRMDWEFERASDGNIALTGELDISKAQEFTLGLALGDVVQLEGPVLLGLVVGVGRLLPGLYGLK